MIRVQAESFDVGAEVNAFTAACGNAGAVVSFTGVVRNTAYKTLDRMVIEHYPGMTERALTQIEADAKARWALEDSLIVHRFGQLRPGEVIMMVATASAHRKDAFEAAEFLMDFLKSRAPFWKKELRADGSTWVESKHADEAALDRWSSD